MLRQLCFLVAVAASFTILGMHDDDGALDDKESWRVLGDKIRSGDYDLNVIRCVERGGDAKFLPLPDTDARVSHGP